MLADNLGAKSLKLWAQEYLLQWTLTCQAIMSALFRGCVVSTVTHFTKDFLKTQVHPFSIHPEYIQFVASKSKMVVGGGDPQECQNKGALSAHSPFTHDA